MAPDKTNLHTLVTGATGNQGGCVARQLLAAGHKVRCLVRDPSKVEAQEIEQLGAELVRGSLEDTSIWPAALESCDSLFIVTPSGDPNELKQVTVIVEAARASDSTVKHVVLSSTTRCEEYKGFKSNDPNNPHPMYTHYFPTKVAMQDAVLNAGFETCTILQVAWLMPDFVMPLAAAYFPELLAGEGKMTSAFGAGKKVALTAPEDIGKFTKLVLENPTKFNSKVIRVVSDALTTQELADALGHATGLSIEAVDRTESEIKDRIAQGDPIAAAQNWERQDGAGLPGDVERLEEIVQEFGITRTTFPEYLSLNTHRLENIVGGTKQ